MERKSLYSLMNEQIIKLDTKSGYEIIDEFITDDGKSMQFIKSLSNVFEVNNGGVYEIAKIRARHSVITFLMGMIFSEFGGLYGSIASVVNLEEANNFRLWLLTSLNHDIAYFSDRLKNGKIDYKKTFKYYLFDENSEDDFLKYVRLFPKQYMSTLAYSYEEILLYDKYARKYHKEKGDTKEQVDHGILGGVITFYNSIRKIKKSGCNENEILIAEASSLTIAQHNIFKSSSKECDRKYPEGLLKKLGHDSSFRINRKTPLLLLLSLVDTIECVKKFGKKDQEDNGNKSFEALTVLKSIFVFSDKEKIEIDLSEFAKKMKKKGIDKEEYWKSISTLSNWTELKVTEKDDVFTIVLE